jgi:hypothetical protein
LSSPEENLISRQDPIFIFGKKINKEFQFASQLPPGQVVNISSQQVEQQVDEVLKYFNIQVEQSDIFSRCMVIIFSDQQYTKIKFLNKTGLQRWKFYGTIE